MPVGWHVTTETSGWLQCHISDVCDHQSGPAREHRSSGGAEACEYYFFYFGTIDRIRGVFKNLWKAPLMYLGQLSPL